MQSGQVRTSTVTIGSNTHMYTLYENPLIKIDYILAKIIIVHSQTIAGKEIKMSI